MPSVEEEKDASASLLVCFECGKDVSDSSARITLLPCGHHYCYRCMIKRQVVSAEENFGKCMKCKCEQYVGEHEWNDVADGDCSPERVRVVHKDPEATSDFDRLRRWVRGVKKRCHDHGLKETLGERGLLFTLQCSLNWTEIDGWDTVFNSFELSCSGDYLPDPRNSENLLECCALLHSAVRPLSSTKNDSDDDDDINGNSACIDNNENSDDPDGVDDVGWKESSVVSAMDTAGVLNYTVMKDKRLMPKMQYALATGNTEYVMYRNKYGDNVEWGSQEIDPEALPHQVAQASYRGGILASAVASDLIMRATRPNEEIGITTATLSDVVEFASEKNLRETLSAFRIISGRKHMLRSKAKAVIKEMLKGIKIKPRELLQITIDNIELKGKSGQFERFTSLLHYITPEEDLKEIGVYTDDDPDAYADLVREQDWLQYMEGKSDEEILNDVLRPGLVEFSHLAKSFLSHAAITLEAMQAGDLPAIDTCLEMDRTGQYDRGTRHPYLYRYSNETDIGVYLDRREREVLTQATLIEQADDTTLTEERKTLFSLNNIVASPIGHMSFGKKDTIFAIFDYVQRVGNAQMEEWRADEDNQGLNEPVSKFLRVIVGDGAPMVTGGSILDGEAAVEGGGRYSEICLLLGAFHFYMEVFKKANQYNEEMATFLASTFKGTNDTSLKYYLNFSDPTNPEKEMSSILLAIYSYAVRCMARDGHTDVSPVSIHQYMIDRAIECPAAMALLNLVLHYETTIMARRAMRLNDLDLLNSVIKLSSAIFSAVHAVNYQRIDCDLLQKFVTMSKLQRKIMEHKGFTAKTEHGSRISLDQVHEKYVKQIRRLCGGKVWKVGMESRLEYAALHATKQSRAKDERSLEAVSKGGYEVGRNTPIGDHDYHVYVKVSIALEKSDILAPGSTIKVKGRVIDDPDRYLSPIDGKPLLGALMRYRSTNQRRSDQYFTKFHMRTQNAVYRSEEEMGIPMTICTAVGIEEAVKKRIIRATSILKVPLKESGTRVELHAEMVKLGRFLGEDQIPTNVSPETNKEIIVETLIRLRKRLQQDEIDQLKEEAKRNEDLITTQEQRSEEVTESQYYVFPNDVKQTPEFIKEYSVHALNL